MGAHTEYGGYIIDYRKTRTFACPDLKDFAVSSCSFNFSSTRAHHWQQLTPFVTKRMEPTRFEMYLPDVTTIERKRVDGMEFLNLLRDENAEEYQTLRQTDLEASDASDEVEHVEGPISTEAILSQEQERATEAKTQTGSRMP